MLKRRVFFIIPALLLITFFAASISDDDNRIFAQSAPNSKSFYYLPPFIDYAPAGLPDFSQTRDFSYPPDGLPDPGFDGPVAMANCLWWLDSKFEPNPVDPRPFYPDPGSPDLNNGHMLVNAYGVWDDHDTNNVDNLIMALAELMHTDANGTPFNYFRNSFYTLLHLHDLDLHYAQNFTEYWDDWPSLADTITDTGSVIFLLGFYRLYNSDPIECCRVGGHYVTVAGVDSANSLIALSDPYLDQQAPGLPSHTDAMQVSHDIYTVASLGESPCFPAWQQPLYLIDYPGETVAAEFWDMNGDAACTEPPQPGDEIITVIEWVNHIYPVDTCEGQYPGDVNHDGVVSVLDVAYLVEYLYKTTGLPDPGPNGDANGDCCIGWADIVAIQGLNLAECTCVDPPLCTDLPLEPIMGKVKHNTNGFNPANGDPLGSSWKSLWPEYGDGWAMSVWIDSDTNSTLSRGDTAWFNHVAPAGRTCEIIARVTPTMTVTRNSNPDDTLYLDLYDPANRMVEPISDPIGSYWHETYPNYGLEYKLVYCMPFNDTLEAGFEIILKAINGPDSGMTDEYIVGSIETDIITTPLPVPGNEYDHNIDGWTPLSGSPIGTQWVELSPYYNRSLELIDWLDNGDGVVSYLDAIIMRAISQDDTTIKYIEDVTLTLKLTINDNETLYVEQMCGNLLAEPIVEPQNTFWYSVWPYSGYQYMITGWEENGSGVLDSCDWVYMMLLTAPDSGIVGLYHVEEVAVDIVSSIFECDCTPGNANLDDLINILDITYLINYLYKQGPAPTPYELCSGDWNCDCVVNILDITALIRYLYLGDFPICDCVGWMNTCGLPLRK